MEIEEILFQASGWVPNNKMLPVLLYRAGISEGGAPALETTFGNNAWSGIWRNGVFSYQHYHSGAHEVLGVGRGSAKLLIGGPDGRAIEVSEGDCLLLPAGTGHQNLGSSSDFEVVGAYPKGQHADIRRGPANVETLARIGTLPIPETDPLLGKTGGLIDRWK